jgi:hypothetical protein
MGDPAVALGYLSDRARGGREGVLLFNIQAAVQAGERLFDPKNNGPESTKAVPLRPALRA